MSRIAKKGIIVPAGTTVNVSGNLVSVKGPKGELSRNFSNLVGINVADNQVSFESKSQSIEGRALLGTTAAHLRNMVNGVNNKYEKKLILEGIGYKMEVKGNDIQFALGFSHPVIVKIPQGIEVSIDKGNMTINGADKESVGSFAAKIRDLKKPEPYKGKGFRYIDEVIRRKQGKKAV